MMTRWASRIALGVAAIAAAVGALDSVVSDDRDALALFALVLACVCVIGATLLGRRRHVSLRADLVRWLERRAGTTGEPIEDIADRSVAAYRAGLVADPDD